METCAQRTHYDAEAVAAPERLKFLSYTAYGIRIGLQTSVDLLPYLPSPLIPGAKLDAAEPLTRFRFQKVRSEHGGSAFRVSGDVSGVFLSGHIDTAARELESRIHQHVAASTEVAVFVHAGVVAWRGRAIVIPGSSHSGKSTLVAALVSQGASYYSDEYAVIDLAGQVHAFPRQLRLRPDILGQQIASLPTLRYGGPLDPLPLGWVLNIRYNPLGTGRPRALTPGQTLLALLENTVAVRRQSELTVQTLKAAVSSATGWQADRADAATAARDILQLLDGI